MDYTHHPLKLIELYIHKQLNWNKESLLESWERVVRQSKHKSIKYEIWFVMIKVTVISIIVVMLIIQAMTYKCVQRSNDLLR